MEIAPRVVLASTAAAPPASAPAAAPSAPTAAPSAARPSPIATTAASITQSVGTGGKNRPEDVRAVQERLKALGFKVEASGRFDPETSKAIKLFASIVGSREQWTGMSDRIAPGSQLARTLFCDEAPRWTKVPDSGTGFVRTDWDNFGHAADSAVMVIRRAGERYQAYRDAHPSTPRIAVNDVSKDDGSMPVRTIVSGSGRRRRVRTIPEHHSHRNGLDIDIRLPKKSGGVGTNMRSADYDRDATYAIIEAFASDPSVTRVFFNDSAIRARALREKKPWASKIQYAGGHHDHIHVDVRAPSCSCTATRCSCRK